MPTFSQVLAGHFRACPERPAIHLLNAKQADLTISYQALVRGAAGFAHLLAQHGVAPGDVVVLILPHGEPLIYGFWGAVVHGAVPSILPPLTEKLLPERYRKDLAALIGITRPRAIVTYPAFADEVQSAIGLVVLANAGAAAETTAPASDAISTSVIVVDQVEPCEPNFEALSGLARDAQDIVLLQHSSGSTGLQKGVALSHQAVFNQLDAYAPAIGLGDSDVIVSWLPLYHDMGLIATFLLPVLRRVPLVLMSPFDWVRAPVRQLQAVTRYGGTLMWLPNFAYNFLASRVRERDLDGVNLSSLRAVINCSEPVYAASHEAFVRKFERYGLASSALATCYAMAENTFAVTQSTLGEPVKQATRTDLVRSGQVSSGAPLANVQVRILDPDLVDVPPGHIGQIAIKSDCMLSGYFHRPDASADAFFDGFYLTGDFGFFEAGELFVTGRKKDLIIVGGKNVYPQDLEQLASEVDGVHAGRVAAFGVFDAAAGTEDVVVVAETDIADEEAREAIADGVRQHITRNSDVAVRQVRLVDAKWLIKTSSGKVARSANRDKFLAELG